MTEEEHIARSMLLGMSYHHGNGEPFYFKYSKGGILEIESMIDAVTLEPLVNPDETPSRDWANIRKRRGNPPVIKDVVGEWL